MHAFHQCNYHERPAFSGFLPGIAGIHGIPMWVFYVNRGQGVVSFGVESKDGSIAEFFSAANAYRVVSERGFRTFLKDASTAGAPGTRMYEPFAGQVPGDQSEFVVHADSLMLRERNEALNLQVDVSYRTVPHRETAGLVREVSITNLANTRRSIEFIDGLAALVPAGIDHSALKNIATTAQAWIRVHPAGPDAALYRVSATLGDTANVEQVERVHFAAGVVHGGGPSSHVQIVYDPDAVFQPQGAYRLSNHVACARIEDLLLRPQSDRGKTPSALFAGRIEMESGETVRVLEVYGAAANEAQFEALHADLSRPGFATEVVTQNTAIMDDIASMCTTETALPDFDTYSRQNFVDNVLRGGLPYVEQTDAGAVYLPVYSRKHGDLERDYNWFVIPPEYFSQGWGNYRDVLQNRRSDVFFVPQVGMENLWEFVSLIQADGYNPLVVKGRSFRLPEAERERVPDDLVATKELVSADTFSPGALLRCIEQDLGSREQARARFRAILGACEAVVNAEHGEGFWIDHWTYVNDLLENCLSVFADQADQLVWQQPVYPFYDSGHFVLPRHRKWTLIDGQVRQYEAVEEPEELRVERGLWLLDATGEVVKVSLGEKLLCLAAIKFLTRDAFGIGVEMEAGKPGWYDALNGLPGILGSSLPESWELLRLIRTLTELVEARSNETIDLAGEIAELFMVIRTIVKLPDTSDAELHARWDCMASAREAYRTNIRNGFSGERKTIHQTKLLETLRTMQDEVQAGLRRGRERSGMIWPTYLVVSPQETPQLSRFLADGSGGETLQFSLRALPLFLEGMVKALAIETESSERREIHDAVMKSDLYDAKLGMLRVNAPLEDEPYDIGRARAFTPGWLENGSIWLHMEYKYLLSLLRAGMYGEFWSLAKTALVPFLNPDIYGRSIHENSSFIASSLHPDASLHGRGFVARLSGSTAEFISIWLLMFFGDRPFRNDNGSLHATFRPFIPAELFDDSGRVSCRLMHQTRVTYVQTGIGSAVPGSTVQPARMMLTLREGGQRVEINGGTLPPPYADQMREGRIREIEIILGNGS